MPMHDWTRVDANLYHDFHQAWVVELRNALNKGVLPAGYYAMTDQTVPPIKPDVLTLQAGTGPTAGGATAVSVSPPRVRYTLSGRGRKTPRYQSQIRVRHNSNNRLVAVIEIVSPANKGRAQDFREFLAKAVGLLRQNVHLLVADPFPPSARDPNGMHDAVWHALTRKRFSPPPDKPLTLASYNAEGAGLYTAYIEPVAVGDALPNMPLFLDDEGYVNVPLEATYQAAWAGFPAPLRPLLETPPPA